ncbi:Cytosolic phospholipase A2 gamma [Anabarilius grahami]|uniref:Cytosolic phospholipase A2 gamma n=1 Tax=Anabarilius grahami TaxID=495550 RepID=A0A3N0Z5W0_ANAGA|nr:Cytosolic phospholipase A2 gamma [Anabarilius grahami]
MRGQTLHYWVLEEEKEPWCMASLYQEPDWSTKLETVKDKIIQRLSGPGVSWTDAYDKLKEYYYEKHYFSLTDVWAVMFITDYVKEIEEATGPATCIISLMQKAGPSPTTLTVRKDVLDHQLPVLGWRGSPLGAANSELLQTRRCLSSHRRAHTNHWDQQSKDPFSHLHSDRQALQIEQRWRFVCVREKNTECIIFFSYNSCVCFSYYMNVFLSADPWFKFTPYEAGYSLTGAFVETSSFGSKFENGCKIKNQPEIDMLYLQDEAVPSTLLETETRDYEDGGLLLNSPYFSVLRKERDIDLIISLDFSDDLDPFTTVKEAAEMCKELNIPFPEVNIPQGHSEKPKDFYVFKDQNTPTVIHIPLFNVVNCGGKLKAALWSYPVEDRIHHAGMDGLLRNCATGCRVDEAFTMDDLVDSISADTSGLRCGHVQLRIVFITPNEVPNIALLGSGGGERAMVALLGSLVQLQKTGLLDCILYLSGVSGSTWCMASVYQEPDWSTKLETVKDKIIQRLSGPKVSWTDEFAKLKKYYSEKDKNIFSLTDVWAVIVVTTYVKEIDKHTLTDYWDEQSKDPFPIYTVIDKECKQKKDGDPWFEFTPYEAGYSLTGAFVETSSFASQFEDGRKIEDQPEIDMLYLQSLCGSALADGDENKKFLWERIKEDPNSPPVDECYQVLKDLMDMNLSVLNGIDPSDLNVSIRTKLNKLTRGKHHLIFQDKKLNLTDKEAAKRYMKQYTEDVCNDLNHCFRFWPENIWIRIVICMAQWKWGRNYNFLHHMKDEAVPSTLLETETRDYEDGGLLLNSPYFSVLRKERDIDLIISLDFSDGDPFTTVKEAAKTCKELNIPFPEVNIPQGHSEKPKDFYVFKDQNTPTVIHIPLFNVVNSESRRSVFVPSVMLTFHVYRPLRGPASGCQHSQTGAAVRKARGLSRDKARILTR